MGPHRLRLLKRLWILDLVAYIVLYSLVSMRLSTGRTILYDITVYTCTLFIITFNIITVIFLCEESIT